jgi:hypothetical protein
LVDSAEFNPELKVLGSRDLRKIPPFDLHAKGDISRCHLTGENMKKGKGKGGEPKKEKR